LINAGRFAPEPYAPSAALDPLLAGQGANSIAVALFERLCRVNRKRLPVWPTATAEHASLTMSKSVGLSKTRPDFGRKRLVINNETFWLHELRA
jgi:hypothetical protein